MNATAVKKIAVKKPVAKKVAAKKAAAQKLAVKLAPATKAPRQVVAKKALVVKPAKAPVPAPASTPVKAPVQSQTPAPKVEKLKIKLVRDSFTMPADDWALIAQLKERAVAFKRPAKKSELLRAGLQALAALPDAKLKAALDSLLPLKPGRPKTDKGSDKADKK